MKKTQSLTCVDINLVTPAIPKQSDKFSWNLSQWLRSADAHRLDRHPGGLRVICTQRSVATGEAHPFVKDASARGDIFIGTIYEGWVHGSRLVDILQGRITTAAFLPRQDGYCDPSNAIDITEWFWTEYVRIGRCLFDHDHGNFIQDADGRYEVHSDREKTCHWCGARLELHHETVTNTIDQWRQVA